MPENVHNFENDICYKNHLKAYLAYELKNIDVNLLQIHNNYV